MATSAPAFPLGSGALAILSVDALLHRLPAENRAAVAWAQKPIRDALRDLRKGELTDEIAQAVARQTWPAMQSVMLAFWRSFAQDRDAWRNALAAELQQDREKLERFVEDDDSRDTIEWLFSFLEVSFNLFLQFMSPEWIHSIPQDASSMLSDDPAFLPFLTGHLALMAALDATNDGQDRERARDLLDIAFLNLNQARSQLRRLGLWLSPFPNETTEARGARTLRYAERIRSALAPDDLATIEAARMRDLR